ncbi:2-dehydro-3-deoxygalactonokinase [Leisingera caerulea]|uniref:2-dehydro-3-deoxygalactonokinase n=1 Tax=Leisingera caerulea TaxID=506591 RepID=UPI0021A300C9|nr:2-dehydro-3-deoxygalactonokinase [Leisingera caerulea]UWQ82698.1 2-dehydro-3-deoxygalactonokinase [Leisingera caerulea]
MNPPQSAAGWLAANLDGLTLTAWTVTDGAPAPAQVLQLPDGSPAALAAELRQAMGGGTVPVVLGGSGLVPPRPVPAVPAELPLSGIRLEGLEVHALPGVSQAAPCGVMQGALAKLSGFLQLNPDWDGVVCLPGAVTHWVQVSAREAVSFQSALTGQLAQAAAQATGLAAGLEAAGDWDKAALADAAADGIAKPELLAARLASVQAASVLGQMPAASAHARIWGLLLGAELAAARPYWLGQNLALIAEPPLQALYAAALEAQALPVSLADPARMALEGLTRAWKGR